MKNVHRRHQIALRRRVKGYMPADRVNRSPQSSRPAFIMAAARESFLGINPRYLNNGALRRLPPDAMDSAEWERAAYDWETIYARDQVLGA